MKMVIIGSGISGIMAASYFFKYNPLLIEKEKELVFLNKNYASIRIKNEEIGILLNTKLRKVEISKQIYIDESLVDSASIKANNLYSRKVTGKLDKRSINYNKEDNLRYFFDETIEGWKGLNQKTDCKLVGLEKNKLIVENSDSIKYPIEYDVCISTISMPQMIKVINRNNKENSFYISPIHVTEVLLDIESIVYQTIYFPEFNFSTYRVNLECNKLLIESLNELKDKEIEKILDIFGLNGIKIIETNKYIQNSGKISAISESQRKATILYLTENYNIYSLGRYAIWKNGIEIDDIYKDLKKINYFINIKDKEERKYEGRID